MLRLWLLIICCFSLNAWAQQCDNSRPLSAPNDNYFVNDDGTLTDMESGLVWMRCAVGQRWNGETCIGEAQTFTWHQAFNKEDEINQGKGFAGITHWRLPSLPELATIVERQCVAPRINLKMFPATPAAAFWTANHKSGMMKQAFAMDFDNQGLRAVSQQARLYLRLVSGRD